MEITLNLLEEFDIYYLFIMLGNLKHEYEQENYKHIELVKLLEGNDKNEDAQSRLIYEKDCMRSNDEKIKILDNIREQLGPKVDKIIGRD